MSEAGVVVSYSRDEKTKSFASKVAGLKLRSSRELLGGFRCELTDDEHNLWLEHLRASALRRKHNIALTRLQVSIEDASDEGYAIDQRLYLDKIVDEIFALAKAWYQSVIVPRMNWDESI